MRMEKRINETINGQADEMEYLLRQNEARHANRRYRIPLKHRIRLWAALRWMALILALLFIFGYVGFFIVLPFISDFLPPDYYPDHLPMIGAIIHALPGSLWFIFSTLQFFASIRVKNPTAHRVMGVIALVTVIISTIGFMLIVVSGKTKGGVSLQVFGVIFGAAWLLCCYYGWYYMRYQKNIEKHREWMTRAYILSYAIIIMRPVEFLYIFLLPNNKDLNVDPVAIVGPLVWIGSLIVIEIHIRRRRSDQADIERHLITIPMVSEEDGVHRLVSYKRDFVPITLIKKVELTDYASLFTFQLPEKAELLTFPGHHVVLRKKIGKDLICRPYTPVTELVRYFAKNGSVHAMRGLDHAGTIALAIKKYRNGPMSSWLHDSMRIGDSVDMMGPAGGFYYTPNEYTSLGLIAGGTGITPMISLITSVLLNSADRTAIRLIYTATNESELMFSDELSELVRQYPKKFDVQFVLGSKSVTLAILRDYLPMPEDSTLVGLCGPTGFCTSVQKNLSALKYQEHTVFTFGETDK